MACHQGVRTSGDFEKHQDQVKKRQDQVKKQGVVAGVFHAETDKIHVKFMDDWVDLSKWGDSHPGGKVILQQSHGRDVTEAVISLHSQEAIARISRMPRVKKGEEPSCPEPSKLQLAYREFQKKLRADGHYERKVVDELVTVVPPILLLFFGTMIAYTWPITASILIGLGMEQCGWIGHDHVHGRGKYSSVLGKCVGGWCNGFSRSWWSNKHNTHHVFTNYVEFDEDINNQPVLFNYPPAAEMDSSYRKFQAFYFPFAYTLLYFGWRKNSIQYCIDTKRWTELFAFVLPNYLWLAYLPLGVAIASIFIGGACVAFVVTLSHESEEMFFDGPEEFLAAQFKGTRDIVCPNKAWLWFFGGMNFQLEHHLFPTLPRVHYPWLQHEVKKLAEAHGLPYKASPLISFLQIHVDTIAKNAKADAIKTAKSE